MLHRLTFIFSVLAIGVYSQSGSAVQLHSESVTASKSKCELYSSSELRTNSKVVLSIVITAESPTPLAKYNEIGEGSAVLVVPEDAKVDYGKIKLLWSDSETGDNFKPYTPPGWVEKKARELAKELAGTLFDKIPVIGSIMGMVFSFMPELPVNQNNDIDANEYDLVTMSWESSIMRIAKRIRVDIPVQLGESKSYGLFATWITKEKNNTGPEFTKVNTITPGLKLNPVIDFMNYTYPYEWLQLTDEAEYYKFVNGACSEINRRRSDNTFSSLEKFARTNYTGRENEYTLYFSTTIGVDGISPTILIVATNKGKLELIASHKEGWSMIIKDSVEIAADRIIINRINAPPDGQNWAYEEITLKYLDGKLRQTAKKVTPVE